MKYICLIYGFVFIVVSNLGWLNVIPITELDSDFSLLIGIMLALFGLVFAKLDKETEQRDKKIIDKACKEFRSFCYENKLQHTNSRVEDFRKAIEE